MPKKTSQDDHDDKDMRTPMEIAEERISKWKSNPERQSDYQVSSFDPFKIYIMMDSLHST